MTMTMITMLDLLTLRPLVVFLPFVSGNPLLTQALHNFLSNARKFTRSREPDHEGGGLSSTSRKASGKGESRILRRIVLSGRLVRVENQQVVVEISVQVGSGGEEY